MKNLSGRWIPLLVGIGTLCLCLLPATPAGGEGDEPGSFRSNLGLLDLLTRQAVVEAADSLNLRPGQPVTIYSSTWHEANWFVGSMLAHELAARGHEVRVLEVATAPPAGSGAQQGARNGQGAGNGQKPQQPEQQQPQEQSPTESAPGDTTGAYADSVAAAEEDPLWKDDTKQQAAPVQTTSNEGKPAPAQVEEAGAAATAFRPGQYPKGEVLDLRVLEFGVTYCDISRVLLFGPVRFTRIGGVYFEVSHLKGPSGNLADVVTAERHRVDRLSGSQRSMAEGASYPFSAPEMKAPSLGRYVEPTVVVAIVSSLVYLFYKNQH